MHLKAQAAWYLAVALMNGCATSPSSQEIVRARAQERWQAVLSGDAAKAYGFLSPGSRSSITLTNYLKKLERGSAFWRKAEVGSVECQESRCNVTVFLEYDLKDAVKGLRRPIGETWLLDEGQWWLVESMR